VSVQPASSAALPPPEAKPIPTVLAAQLSDRAAGLDLFGRLQAAREAITGHLVFTTSFGIEDQAIAHAIFSQDLDIDVVTLETGRLFPETHDVWRDTEARYGRRIRAFAPDGAGVEKLLADQGIGGFRASIAARQACCQIRKVVPLGRALADADGWVTGLRVEQSVERSDTHFSEHDSGRKLIKVNPLFDWSRQRVLDFVARENIPYNVLHDRGFASIGCAPCTRAVGPDEHERAGRWWWEQQDQKECGLHVHSTDANTSAHGAVRTSAVTEART
jgi:phosphoadenosine phosphosulfate reductase